MTKEQKATLSPKEQNEIYGLEILASICYNTQMNIEFLRSVQRNLPQSKVKDVAMYYMNDQQTWLNKMFRGLREMGRVNGVDFYTAMKKDLDNTDLVAMYDILSNIKQVPDTEGVATIIETCVGVQDLSPVLPNLKAIIRNQKLKEECSQ